VKESTGQYRDELGKYRTMLAAMEEPLTPINPQEFQDELRKSVDETRKKAIEKGVTLPDNFFYGFGPISSDPAVAAGGPRVEPRIPNPPPGRR
jgi:hypothetical protein